MKKAILGSILLLLCLAGHSQSKTQDSVAVLIIDRMSDVIGDLKSCSFQLNTSNDVRDQASRLVKKFASFEVYMNGPDKMLVNARGHRGHRQFMYNGAQLAYYSFDENNYGIISTPDNILDMIDSVNAVYDIDFPAADFFYPAFTDDLLHDADTLSFLGIDNIDGKEYFHVLAIGKKLDFQFWINNDAYNLPAKFAITYKTEPGSPQYFASFSNWQLNPDLPLAMFNFQPPPGATEVRMLSKNDLKKP